MSDEKNCEKCGAEFVNPMSGPICAACLGEGPRRLEDDPEAARLIEAHLAEHS